MATSTTANIAEAISLLSDVLSAEVAASQHSLDDDETAEDTVALYEHEELKDLVDDFAGENLAGLEEVGAELQAAVGSDDVDEDDEYWSNLEDEDETEADDSGDGDADTPAEGDDEAEPAEPTDEEKIETLMQAGEELQQQIEEHEQTIKDFKNTMKSVLDDVDALVTAAETFRDQVGEY